MRKTLPIRTFIVGTSLLSSSLVTAQNVGINATGAAPDASAMLDIVSANRGLLVPRVALTATTNAVGPIAAPTTSLLVYNTASVSDVTPGYYYWDGAAWVRFQASNTIDDWKLLGNAGTVAGTNFVGTTDNIALTFRTNNLERLRLSNTDYQVLAMNSGTDVLPFYTWNGDNDMGIYRVTTNTLGFSTGSLERFKISTTAIIANDIGQNVDFRIEGDLDANLFFSDASTDRIGIGLNAPTTKLDVSSGTQDAVYGHSTNVGGYLGRETNFNFGVTPQTIQGAGVFAANPSAGYTSIFAQSTGAANVAASISYSSVWIPQYSLSDNSTTSQQRAIYGQANLTNTTNANLVSGVQGYMNRGAITGNPGYSVGLLGISNSANQDAFGVWGSAFSNQGTGGTLNFGGYFEAYNYNGSTIRGYAFVGGRTGGSNRKIEGVGSVNEIVPTEKHGRVTLTCPESPEYWYQDYYTVELINGKAHLELDPILSDIIVVDENNPIRVFVTPTEMLYFNGVTVINQTATGVDLIELNGGTNSGKLYVQVIVKPKTNYGEGRFVQAPGPAWLKPEFEPEAAKAANQGGKEIFNWPADWEVYGYEEYAKQKLEEIRTKPKATMPAIR